MRFGSVCSGIEAASVAWAALGWEAAWLAEVDVAASSVLAHRLGATAPKYPLDGTEKSMGRIEWGNRVTNWGDMTRLPEAVRKGEAEAPDILCGGTPCQGFSVAGLRGGLSDPRGQLTLSFVELANAIDDRRAACGQQPSIIFWENVPGVRSDSGNAFGHFLAALVGAENPIEPGPRPDDGRSSAHWTWKKEAGEHVPRWTSAGVVTGPRRTVAWRSSDAQYAGLAQRRERVFLVGSAREGFDPQVVLFEFDGVRRDSAPSREKASGNAQNVRAGVEHGSHWDCSGNPHPSLTQSHNAGGVGASNQELFSQRGAYLVPDRSEPTGVNQRGFRMVAFGEYADDETASTMKSRDYKDATDLVLTPAIKLGLVDTTGHQGDRFVGPGDVTQALSASAGNNGGGGGTCILDTQMAVRRLMPVECERLQGFPDGWTDVPVGTRSAADGPRYKQLGNSWAIQCVSRIGARIAPHVRELDARQSCEASPMEHIIKAYLGVQLNGELNGPT